MPDTATATRPNDKLAAALAHAKFGLNVFPLRSYRHPGDDASVVEREEAEKDAKRPAIDNWQNLATTDLRQIKEWWSTNPDFNIGISTENLLVVDVDPRHGGVETFKNLFESEHLIGEGFPPSLASRTQSGGTHMFYWLPPNTTVRGGAHKLGRGVDVKSHGGYVVGAGSTIAGRPYGWKKGYGPDDIDFKPAPQWLIDRCNTAKPKSADAGKVIVLEDEVAVRAARRWLEGHAPRARIGERGFTAYKVAARFYDFGVNRETCIDLLTDWSEQYCEAPMDAADIEHAADSARRNRENAIGAKHPDAPGFEAVEIAPKSDIGIQISDKPREKLHWLRYNDAADQALTLNSQPLIDGLLDREAMSVWYGESNSGKTFVMLDAAWHIAAGRPWAGMETHRGGVAYVAAEGGRGILKRVRALRERYRDAGDVPLNLVPCPVDLLRPDADVRPLAKLIRDMEAATGVKVELIVIDTLSRAIAGGNENDSQDMGALVAHLDALRVGLKAHVAVVHHTGKDKAKGARGHSLLRAATDTEVEIDNRTVTVTKQRDMDGDLSLPFRLVPARLGVASMTGREVASCTVDMGRPGDAAEPLPLTPLETSIVEAIDARLADIEEGVEEAEGAHRGAHGINFNWEFVASACRDSGTRQRSTRQSVLGWLSSLSDKGVVKKVSPGQYVRVVSKMSKLSEMSAGDLSKMSAI